MEALLAVRRITCIVSLVAGVGPFVGVGGCGGSAFIAAPEGGSDDGPISPHGDAGPSVDAAGPCQCTGPAPGVASVRCSDGSISGPECATRADGTCSWQIRSCPTPVCPALGCNPACPNGVLKDSNGCDTCTCAPSPDGGSGTACKTSANCTNGEICGFRETDGCSAVGSCFPAPGIICNAYSPGCACDGTIVSVICNGLPTGYVTKPLQHTGVCSDGGSPDASGDH